MVHNCCCSKTYSEAFFIRVASPSAHMCDMFVCAFCIFLVADNFLLNTKTELTSLSRANCCTSVDSRSQQQQHQQQRKKNNKIEISREKKWINPIQLSHKCYIRGGRCGARWWFVYRWHVCAFMHLCGFDHCWWCPDYTFYFCRSPRRVRYLSARIDVFLLFHELHAPVICCHSILSYFFLPLYKCFLLSNVCIILFSFPIRSCRKHTHTHILHTWT